MTKLGILNAASTGTVVLLPLEPGADGEARSIVDFQPLPSVQALTTRTEIKLQTAAETSRKGVVRILLKVMLPYSGLYPSDVATGESNLKFSPTRSSGVVSAHLVLTLPKECVQDLVQQKAGSTGRDCALAHILTVLGILNSIQLTGNGATTAYEGVSYYLTGTGGETPVELDVSSGTPRITAQNPAGMSKLTGLIDRACRGYTPLSDVETVGVTTMHQP